MWPWRGHTMLLQMLDGGIYLESGHADGRLWEAGYQPLQQVWRELRSFLSWWWYWSSGIAASTDHCPQCQVGLSLKLGLETMIISFKACFFICFKQTWQQTVKTFPISCIRELSYIALGSGSLLCSADCHLILWNVRASTPFVNWGQQHFLSSQDCCVDEEVGGWVLPDQGN